MTKLTLLFLSILVAIASVISAPLILFDTGNSLGPKYATTLTDARQKITQNTETNKGNSDVMINDVDVQSGDMANVLSSSVQGTVNQAMSTNTGTGSASASTGDVSIGSSSGNNAQRGDMNITR